MFDKVKQSLPLFIVLLSIVIVSITLYTKFTSFKPKTTEEIEKVRENEGEEVAGIPYPKDYKLIRKDHTSKGEQITIEVNQTPQETQDFYETVLITSGWEIENESENDGILSTKYKTNDQKITITSAWQEKSQNTIVSIDITP